MKDKIPLVLVLFLYSCQSEIQSPPLSEIPSQVADTRAPLLVMNYPRLINTRIGEELNLKIEYVAEGFPDATIELEDNIFDIEFDEREGAIIWQPKHEVLIDPETGYKDVEKYIVLRLFLKESPKGAKLLRQSLIIRVREN